MPSFGKRKRYKTYYEPVTSDEDEEPGVPRSTLYRYRKQNDSDHNGDVSNSDKFERPEQVRCLLA